MISVIDNKKNNYSITEIRDLSKDCTILAIIGDCYQLWSNERFVFQRSYHGVFLTTESGGWSFYGFPALTFEFLKALSSDYPEAAEYIMFHFDEFVSMSLK